MLELLGQYEDQSQLLNLMNYVQFRATGCILTALFLSLLLGGPMIKAIQRGQTRGAVSADAAQATRAQLARLGGFVVFAPFAIAVLLWSELDNPYVWVFMGLAVVFAGIGCANDLALMRNGHVGRLHKLVAFWIGAAAALVAASAMVWIDVITSNPTQNVDAAFFFDVLGRGDPSTALYLALLSGWGVQLFYLYPLLGAALVLFTAHAMRQSVETDDFAIAPSVILIAPMALTAVLVGRVDYAEYLRIPHVAGASELFTFLCAVLGSLVGFALFNIPATRVSLGDTGSLFIGVILAATAFTLGFEIIMLIGVLIVFVFEASWVGVRRRSYKGFGRTVFSKTRLG